MDRKEFANFRKRLNKTQKEISELLGLSINAVHSYEQGWRNIPGHVERQLLFLASMKSSAGKRRKPCWTTKKCPRERKEKCPAWEFKAGRFCWLINGTIWEGIPRKDWDEKMGICRRCEVFQGVLLPAPRPTH